MMFKSQIKIFRNFFEKVALRAILRYDVLTHLGNLENVAPFVLKCIYIHVHNYWSNIHGALIQNVKITKKFSSTVCIIFYIINLY